MKLPRFNIIAIISIVLSGSAIPLEAAPIFPSSDPVRGGVAGQAIAPGAPSIRPGVLDPVRVMHRFDAEMLCVIDKLIAGLVLLPALRLLGEGDEDLAREIWRFVGDAIDKIDKAQNSAPGGAFTIAFDSERAVLDRLAEKIRKRKVETERGKFKIPWTEEDAIALQRVFGAHLVDLASVLRDLRAGDTRLSAEFQRHGAKLEAIARTNWRNEIITREEVETICSLLPMLGREVPDRLLTDRPLATEELAAIKKAEAEMKPGTVFKDCPECPEMVILPAGSFDMGSPPGSETLRRNNEGPVHRVAIGSAFAMGKTEVTRGQFATFVNETHYNAGDECFTDESNKYKKRSGRNWRNPGYQQDDSHPAACLNWNDAKAYTEWLSKKTGKPYRLPSEAEWEYAARGNTSTAHYWGDDQACGYANLMDKTYSQVFGVPLGKECTDGYAYAAPGGSFKPNAFGLYDMIGNVWEWVDDSYHDNYNDAPGDGTTWGGDGAKRVIRGGSWSDLPMQVRASERSTTGPAYRSMLGGFRVARMLQAAPQKVQREEADREKQESARREREAREAENQRLAAERNAAERARQEAARPANEGAEMRPGKVFKDCADCPEMVMIPTGSFAMGGTERDERPIHRVRVKAFAMGKTEVTQGQWRSVMGNNPSHFSGCGDGCPLEQVSWDDAKTFIQRLNAKTGKSYRLPSEAEWEFACRAGGTHTYCGSESVDSVAWYSSNSGSKTHSVAGKQANAWGLHDMSGNVWEWVEDCLHANYNGAPSDGSAWTSGTFGNCSGRILRGGSWNFLPQDAQAAYRHGLPTGTRLSEGGFRLARMLP